MKIAVLLLFLLTLSFNAMAQDYPSLSSLKNLSSLNSKQKNLLKSNNLPSMNSKNTLPSLSLSKKKNINAASKPKTFSFSIAPYIWATAIGGTVGYTPDGQKYGFNKSFTDAVKYLKMAAAVVGKFKYKRVSFVYDISYINLKGFGTEIPAASAPHIVSANWTVKQTLYDLFLTYLFPSSSKKTMVDIYGGGRLFALNTESTLIDTNGAQKMTAYNNSFLDPVIGVNAEYLLSKQWFAWTKGDIGGFGVNSQMTWQLNAGAGYLLSPNFPLTLGFKYVGVNHDKNRFVWTVNEYGFTLGIGYKY